MIEPGTVCVVDGLGLAVAAATDVAAATMSMRPLTLVAGGWVTLRRVFDVDVGDVVSAGAEPAAAGPAPLADGGPVAVVTPTGVNAILVEATEGFGLLSAGGQHAEPLEGDSEGGEWPLATLTEDAAAYASAGAFVRFQAAAVAATAAAYKPPKGVVAAAKRILAIREEKGDEVKGGTAIGWGRARQLASGKPVSADVVKRMSNFFTRHAKNFAVAPEYKDEPWKDRGWTAFMLWGGAPGRAWSVPLAKRIRQGRA